MKKLIIFLFILLSGCTPKENRPVKITVYYIEGCGYCDTFKEYATDYLNKTFSDLTIEYLDLDDEEVLQKYDEMLTHLDSFDEKEYKSTPLIVYEPYFVISGYEKGEEKYLANDIIHVLNGEELSDDLKEYRWEFIEYEENH